MLAGYARSHGGQGGLRPSQTAVEAGPAGEQGGGAEERDGDSGAFAHPASAYRHRHQEAQAREDRHAAGQAEHAPAEEILDVGGPPGGDGDGAESGRRRRRGGRSGVRASVVGGAGRPKRRAGGRGRCGRSRAHGLAAVLQLRLERLDPDVQFLHLKLQPLHPRARRKDHDPDLGDGHGLARRSRPVWTHR